MSDTAELLLDDEPTTKLNTPALENLLRAKYPRDRYALFFDVPDAVSLRQQRRIDALAFGIWQSVGREIQGFELKISRSDWLRELKQVDKADPFIALCDRFWLVTADSKIAKLDEVPACWGWMTATASGLRVQRPASKLPGVGNAIPRDFLIGVLRKLQDNLLNSADVRTAIEERIKTATDRFDERVQSRTVRLQQQFEALQAKVTKFKEESGIDLDDWRMGDIGRIVKQLKQLGYGDGLDHVPELLQRQENVLRSTLERVAEARAQLGALGRSQ